MADAGGSVRQSLLAAAACPPPAQTWVRRGTARQHSLLILILLLAFALRVFHLDTQSIWYDEGLSLYLAQQPLAQNITLSATTDHSPLHTLLLGGWLAFTVERLEDAAVDDFSLDPSGRYRHSEAYLRRVLALVGIAVESLEIVTLRLEGGQPVIGFLVTARKTP